MKRYLCTLLLLGGLATGMPPQAPAQDRLDLESILTDETDLTRAAGDALEPGDNKSFSVTTDDDITSLELGDIYRSEKSLFKVTTIRSKGSKGGSFAVERIAGRADPGRKWTRVSGLGPLTIVSRETVWSLYRSGGWLMHAIMLCLVSTVVIALNSVWVYRRSRQCPPPFVDQAHRALQRGDVREFEELSHKENGLFGRICRAMAVKFHASTLEDIKVRCEIEAGRQVGLLRAPLRGLSLIAAVAPLLGLLGTVIGIMMCFESVASDPASASKAQALAAGIRVALLTTVGGLSVAIPALFILFVFNHRLGAIVSDCESLTEQFLHEIALIKRTEEQVAARPAPAAPARQG
jgi:biopolymer transport protein ExbB